MSECNVCGINTSRTEGKLCDSCRTAQAYECLVRFVDHNGICWQWIDPGNDGASCSDLRRGMRLLKIAVEGAR